MKKTLIYAAILCITCAGCAPKNQQEMKNDDAVIETIMARRSIRHYTLISLRISTDEKHQKEVIHNVHTAVSDT